MILFDCDGVLLDSEVIADRLLFRLLSDLRENTQSISNISDPVVLEEWIVDQCGQTDENIVHKFANITQISPPQDFLKDFQSTLLKTLSLEVQPIIGIQELLSSLGENWTVASNSSFKRLRISLKKAGLYNLCESRLFSSEQVSRPKPAPDLHLHIAKQYDVLPDECLVVEDSPTGVTAGLQAGMRVVGFTAGSHITPKHVQKLKKAGAENIFKNVEELSAFLKDSQDGSKFI